MNGHTAPSRKAAPSWKSTPSRAAFFLAVLSLAILGLALLGLPLLVAGCGDEPAATTTSAAPTATSTAGAEPPSTTTSTVPAYPVTLTDDLGQSVTIPTEPQRIVSTAPAGTEILFALGAGPRVVGVSSLDDFPPEVASIAKVGDFQPNTEAIMGLGPDLVLGFIGNEEQLAPLAKNGTPVLIFNPRDVAGIYTDIDIIGRAAGRSAEASTLVASLRAEIESVAAAAAKTQESPRVFYAIDNTLWTSGPGSFVDELLTLAHATNVANSPDLPEAQEYFQLSPERLIALDPDVILLPNTAYKSAEEFTKDARFANLTAVKNGKVVVIDDVIITRPGPRVAQGLRILAEAIHPGM